MMAGNAKTPPEREDFYRRIRPHNLAPLWEVLGDLITPQPTSDCRPAIWRYADVRPAIMESGELITATEAERRVLVGEHLLQVGKRRFARIVVK